MAEGKRYTCIECKWYSEEGGPIGSCESTGYRLELEDFCRVSGNPMMIRGFRKTKEQNPQGYGYLYGEAQHLTGYFDGCVMGLLYNNIHAD